jgi:hypothetical protein
MLTWWQLFQKGRNSSDMGLDPLLSFQWPRMSFLMVEMKENTGKCMHTDRHRRQRGETGAGRERQRERDRDTEREGGRERLCTVENTELLSWIFNYIR